MHTSDRDIRIRLRHSTPSMHSSVCDLTPLECQQKLNGTPMECACVFRVCSSTPVMRILGRRVLYYIRCCAAMQCNADLIYLFLSLHYVIIFSLCSMVHSGCSVHVLFVFAVSSHILHCLGRAIHPVLAESSPSVYIQKAYISRLARGRVR